MALVPFVGDSVGSSNNIGILIRRQLKSIYTIILCHLMFVKDVIYFVLYLALFRRTVQTQLWVIFSPKSSSVSLWSAGAFLSSSISLKLSSTTFTFCFFTWFRGFPFQSRLVSTGGNWCTFVILYIVEYIFNLIEYFAFIIANIYICFRTSTFQVCLYPFKKWILIELTLSFCNWGCRCSRFITFVNLLRRK